MDHAHRNRRGAVVRRSLRAGLVAAAFAALVAAPAAAHGPPKITGGPTGTVTAHDAEFTVEYDEPAPGQTFECRLDEGEWAPCTDDTLPTGSQTYENLSEGPHAFRVRRVSSLDPDPLGDDTPSEPRTWTIASPQPDPPPDGDPGPAPPPGPAGPARLEPCYGIAQITDPGADSHHANTDVTRAFFDHRGGITTANIDVARLDPAIDHAENDRLLWRVIFTAPDGARRYVQATVARGATTATYEFGRADGLEATKEGETTGALFTGTPGTVQIAIPDALAPAGGKLAAPVVISGEANALTGEVSWFERAPGGDDPSDPAETAVGADWTVASCEPAPRGDTAAPAAGPGPAAAAPRVAAILLDAPARRIRFGRLLRLTGRLAPGTSGIPVEIVAGGGRVVATVVTGADGIFAAAVRLRRDTVLRAVAEGVSSGTLPVKVDPLIRLRAVRLRGRRAARRVLGTVRPARRGTVDVELRSGGQWIVVGTARVRRGRFALTIPGRRGRLRAVFTPEASR